MADLECRLECGCWIAVSPDDSWRVTKEHRDEWMSAVEVPRYSELAVGYAIAASRGVGPWAERWPG